MRTYVYIDGFNLYYAVKRSGYKWLNPKLLAEALLPSDYTVERVKYYTARVSGAADPGQPRRQQIYLNALATIPEIEICFGHFLAKVIWRPLANLPVGDRAIVNGTESTSFPVGTYDVDAEAGVASSAPETLSIGKYSRTGAPPNGRPTLPGDSFIKACVHSMEEKGSDVNLATHLINDAWAERFEAAAVISNDTDLVEPIRIVASERQRPVFLLCPAKRGAAPALSAVASTVRHIRAKHLRSALFPDTLPGSKIAKPAEWQ